MSILIEAKRIEARYALLESLDNSNRKSYVQWETVGTYLREAALSPQQIQGLFGEIEKTATAGGANRYFIGKIPIVSMYNKALTAAEVLQNFNATKSRFSL